MVYLQNLFLMRYKASLDLNCALKRFKGHYRKYRAFHLHKWRNINRRLAARDRRGLNPVIRIIKKHSKSSLWFAMTQIKMHSQNIINVLAKIERRFSLEPRSLLSNVIGIETSRNGCEKVIANRPHSKLNQKGIISKNGRKYLSILLRKLYWSKVRGLFGWYQKHTLLMRQSVRGGVILNNLFKLRG